MPEIKTKESPVFSKVSFRDQVTGGRMVLTRFWPGLPEFSQLKINLIKLTCAFPPYRTAFPAPLVLRQPTFLYMIQRSSGIPLTLFEVLKKSIIYLHVFIYYLVRIQNCCEKWNKKIMFWWNSKKWIRTGELICLDIFQTELECNKKDLRPSQK